LARSCALALKRNYKPVIIICADLLIAGWLTDKTQVATMASQFADDKNPHFYLWSTGSVLVSSFLKCIRCKKLYLAKTGIHAAAIDR
jgi:hypothetical protein